MKYIFKFFQIAACIAVIVITFIACQIVDNEEGGTKQRAITLIADAWAEGSISSTRNEQWFKFTATAGTQYLHVSFGTLTDLYIQLYDSNNNEVGGMTNLSGSTTYASLTITSGREYHIKVSANGSGTGTYRIGFNSTTLTPGTLAGAVTLSIDTWADGALTAANGEQWYKITAAATMQYLHVFFGTLTDLYVQLNDNNGTTLGSRTNLYGTTTYTSLLLVSGELYHIKVTSNGSGTGTFRIAFNISTTAPAVSD